MFSPSVFLLPTFGQAKCLCCEIVNPLQSVTPQLEEVSALALYWLCYGEGGGRLTVQSGLTESEARGAHTAMPLPGNKSFQMLLSDFVLLFCQREIIMPPFHRTRMVLISGNMVNKIAHST